MRIVYDTNWDALQQKIVKCTLCPRLVTHRENVKPAPAHKNENHWRRPVPGIGDKNAKLLILGLAPSPQGGNRTGRIFTGDQTGKFLVKQLHKAGFANQDTSVAAEDGLKYTNCYLTAAVKCVPPQHKPLKSEFDNCSGYFSNEFFLLKNLTCVLALGKNAFDTYLNFLKTEAGIVRRGLKFTHGLKIEFEGWPKLFTSFHPTPQNVNTGKLTDTMFATLLNTIKDSL